MNLAADAGGGGSAPDLVLDADVLQAVAKRLGTAATDLDRVGRSLPTGGDFGDAAGVVSGSVALAVGVAGKLMVEADTLGGLVAMVTSSTVETDRANAETFLVKGFTS